MIDSTLRFSDRVADYVRYRPGYPDAVVRTLEAEAGLAPSAVVADVGSGTGLSAEPFLRAGYTLYGVEPNPQMREAAERLLSRYPRFHSVDGTAEETTLPDAGIDLVTAGQAFHWFHPERTRREFARVLRPGGHAALFWNSRLTEASSFLHAYEELLLEFATDYAQVNHRNLGAERLAWFFGGAYTSRTFPNRQGFDFKGLRGRLLSSSYAPAAGHPRHAPMLAALERLFAAHAVEGRVWFEYETELFFGRPAGLSG